jgi:hypothetical protein
MAATELLGIVHRRRFGEGFVRCAGRRCFGIRASRGTNSLELPWARSSHQPVFDWRSTLLWGTKETTTRSRMACRKARVTESSSIVDRGRTVGGTSRSARHARSARAAKVRCIRRNRSAAPSGQLFAALNRRSITLPISWLSAPQAGPRSEGAERRDDSPRPCVLPWRVSSGLQASIHAAENAPPDAPDPTCAPRPPLADRARAMHILRA